MQTSLESEQTCNKECDHMYQRTLHHKMLYFMHCSASPVDENPFTILDSLMPSSQILHSWFTKSAFESWDFAADKLTLSYSICSQRFFRGPKHVTSSGWRMLVTCGADFTIISFSFMAFSMTGNVIWVMWPSKSSNSGLSFTIFFKDIEPLGKHFRIYPL